jgi:hypothetical protein
MDTWDTADASAEVDDNSNVDTENSESHFVSVLENILGIVLRDTPDIKVKP